MNKFDDCHPFFPNPHFFCAFPEFLGATGATGPLVTINNAHITV